MNETLNCTHSGFTEKQSMQPNGARTHSIRHGMQPGTITCFYHPALLSPSIAAMQSSQRHTNSSAASQDSGQLFGCPTARSICSHDLVQTDSALLNSSQCWVLWNWWVYYESEGTNTTSTQPRLLFTLCCSLRIYSQQIWPQKSLLHLSMEEDWGERSFLDSSAPIFIWRLVMVFLSIQKRHRTNIITSMPVQKASLSFVFSLY